VIAFQDYSIRKKLLITSMLSKFGAMILVSAAFMTYDFLSYRASMAGNLSTLGEVISLNAASAVIFNDPATAAKTLASLEAKPAILSAGIYAPDGHVFASWDRNPASETAPPAYPAEQKKMHLFQKDRLTVLTPMILDRSFIGMVYIQSDLRELTSRLTRYAGIVLVVMLLALLVVALISFKTAQKISEPLLRLAGVAKTVSEKNDYSLRAPVSGSDEVGLLTRAFNEMMSKIERQEELRRENMELEKQNRRVQEANRLKSEFLANMSHELRTPLNAIIGFAEMMHDGKVGSVSDQHKEFLGDILTSSRHLQRLINDVLDLAKVEAGKMEFVPEPVNLLKLAEEMRDTLRSLAARKRIFLNVDVAPEFKTSDIMIDPGKLKQVLYNFLSNAIKFTPEEGRVTVRVFSDQPDFFRLEVEDTGIGIKPEDLSKLFVEFQQLDASTAKKYQGTGLGLSLTKRMVEAQGGEVGVRSEVGRGSIFFAVLPKKGQHLVSSSVPIEDVLRDPTEGRRILVIEDDAQERKWLQQTLSKAGYSVELAWTGAQALTLCREQVFDAITLDILLPDTSGSELLKVIRASGPNRSTPVIVVSVVSEKEMGRGFAIHDFLVKPVKTEDLLASLQRGGIYPDNSQRILVVEDEAGNRKLMEKMLNVMGYTPICCESGESALDMVAKNPPAAIILDLLLPGIDGFQFLDRLKQIRPGGHPPVIVWTNKDLTATERSQLQQSAKAIVSKNGGQKDDVLRELEACLNKPFEAEEKRHAV
jgi:signal transduction histidine kinase/DNA-binding response OmpR family regulator